MSIDEKKKKITEAYEQGRAAYHKRENPSSCPYLRAYGDHSTLIEAWLEGWEEEFSLNGARYWDGM